MKKLILLCSFIFSTTAIFAQAEETTETTIETSTITETLIVPTYKNAITGSLLFTGNGTGVAVDYRRRFGEKDELIIGINRVSSSSRHINFGYRRYFIQKEKFGMSIGINGRFRNNRINDSILGLSGIPRIRRASIQGMIGAYYKASSRLDIMFETRLASPVAIFNRNSGHGTKLGIRYNF